MPNVRCGRVPALPAALQATGDLSPLTIPNRTRHWSGRAERESAGHVELHFAVGQDVRPEQRCQPALKATFGESSR